MPSLPWRYLICAQSCTVIIHPIVAGWPICKSTTGLVFKQRRQASWLVQMPCGQTWLRDPAQHPVGERGRQVSAGHLGERSGPRTSSHAKTSSGAPGQGDGADLIALAVQADLAGSGGDREVLGVEPRAFFDPWPTRSGNASP
jgi:hypothetical protein